MIKNIRFSNDEQHDVRWFRKKLTENYTGGLVFFFAFLDEI